MDPLSEVILLLKPHNYMCGGFDTGGQMSVRFEKHEGIKCYALVSGEGWLLVDGVKDAIHLKAGDCFLLPHGLPFGLTSDLSLTPMDGAGFVSGGENGGIVTVNGGGDSLMLAGHFVLTGSHAEVLLAVLPPVVHVRSKSGRAEMRWCLDRMRREIRENRPGALVIVQQLALMMLVQVLRLHLEEERGGVGWLSALANTQMKAVLTAIHTDPARAWTLATLARQAGMSRSIFAEKFKAAVGISAMEYLTHWRMILAGDKLRNTDDSISTIAWKVGYESESAFGKAFKRTIGQSPRQYAKGAISVPNRLFPIQEGETVGGMIATRSFERVEEDYGVMA